MKKLKFSLFAALCTLFAVQAAMADAPTGYYTSCEGKAGKTLLEALHATISSHTNVGYDGLWEVYQTSDVYPDGSIWDIYSNKHWSTTSSRCGNYKVVGDCYNREHSFPKSWFGGKVNPMYADAFHLYPTDGKVNGQRSNFPYGECANGTTLPDNGSVKALGKLGTSTFSGYSGTVFEPVDDYKGDLARSYFYMATCYNDKIASWSSEMLAGNSYPAFNTWALNLLLKWHRQDPVSEKELTRNDAIYAHQHNRNPFIDHPELVEYIWGNKMNESWQSSSSATPTILLPVDQSTINLGIGAVNIAGSTAVAVKGHNLTEPLYITVSGNGFSVSPSSLSAAQANAGTTVTITCLSTTAGTISGTIELTSGEAHSSAGLTKSIETGLPITDPTDISPYSFNLGWVYIGDGSNYMLHLKQGNEYVQGYPVEVPAMEERWQVTGLDPETVYTYYLTSATLSSRTISITTGALTPDIQVLFDGQLHFTTAPGEPSESAELLLEIENAPADIITISVTSPFEVSTDKSTWSTSIDLEPEEDRFYLRLNGSDEGSYETAIAIVSGSYRNDEASATGRIADTVAFLETFEETTPETINSYATATLTGTACRWSLNKALFNPDDTDKRLNGSKALRVSKNADDIVAMDEDKEGGLGTVSFEAMPYGTDDAPDITLEYSTDGGYTWIEAHSFTINDTDTRYSATINRSGSGRIRFRQTSGKRWILDNIGITDCSAVGAVKDLEYHSWDAFCRDGDLIIECNDKSAEIAVYGIDGITWFNGSLPAGEHRLSLPKGLYIVVSDDFVRRVLIK